METPYNSLSVNATDRVDQLLRRRRRRTAFGAIAVVACVCSALLITFVVKNKHDDTQQPMAQSVKDETSNPIQLDAVRLWTNPGTDYEWPEQEEHVPRLDSTAATGLCFSGGGSRAFVAAAGILRALTHLGLMENVRYISSISGGAWATTVYTYYQAGNPGVAADDRELLGDIRDPADITWDTLKSANPIHMTHWATQSLRDMLITLASDLEGNFGWDELWQTTIGRLFLAPAGVPANALFSLNSSTINDILQRNPGLAESSPRFVAPRKSRPYMILGGTLMGPYSLLPLAPTKRQFTRLEFTPLYVGEPYTQQLQFTSSTGKNENLTVGGYVEPFGFGGTPLPGSLASSSGTTPQQTRVSMSVSSPMFHLYDATGISSDAPGSMFATRDLESDDDSLPGWFEGLFERLFAGHEGFLDPSRQYTSPSEIITSQQQQQQQQGVSEQGAASSTKMVMGDGGVLENLGIIPLILRGVKKIVVFDNSDQELQNSTVWNPVTTPPTESSIDVYISALFGYNIYSGENPELFLGHNQIFDKAAFAPLVQKMQAAKEAGNGILVTVPMITVENAFWGVKAGIEVEVTWMYLDRASNFEAALPSEIRQAIVDGNKPTGKSGPLVNFPLYETIELLEKGSELEFTELTATQVNALGDLTTWTTLQHAAALEAALPRGSPMSPSPTAAPTPPPTSTQQQCQQCVALTELFLHTHEWCWMDETCYALDAVLNPCSDAVCASKSSLSSCTGASSCQIPNASG